MQSSDNELIPKFDQYKKTLKGRSLRVIRTK
jgi:hypothetical protein